MLVKACLQIIYLECGTSNTSYNTVAKIDFCNTLSFELATSAFH